ncbi:MAG: TAXI family TRAP transporter solute-binding subunit [Desulfobacteraceae bacterium]|nr:TAXI family TRAP transporter solute-binding subunit [Desulfobacteraceae bacterium]
MKKMIKFIIACAVTVALALPAAANAEDLPRFVNIATNPQGSIYYVFGGTFAKVISNNTPIKARVQASSGSSAYIPAVSRGKIELGVNNTNDARLAYQGKQPFVSSPNIRVLTVVCPLVVGMMVRDKSDIKTMEDLRGKRVAAEFPAQIAVRKNIESMLAANGLSYDDVKKVPVENLIQGVQALMEGRVDATAIAIFAGKAKEANSTIPGGVRFLSIDGSPEGAERMAESFPGTYPVTVEANAPGTVGIKEESTVQAYDVFLIGSTHLSEKAGYTIVKALAENPGEVQKGHGMLSSFNKEIMAKPNVTIPYHDGAIKFYKEEGLWDKEMDKVQQ